MTHEEAVRQKYAYLAGLIKGDERERWKKIYEEEHAGHDDKRYDWCPICEMRQIETMWERPSLMDLVMKKKKHKDPDDRAPARERVWGLKKREG
jgi:hypothetical protein